MVRWSDAKWSDGQIPRTIAKTKQVGIFTDVIFVLEGLLWCQIFGVLCRPAGSVGFFLTNYYDILPRLCWGGRAPLVSYRGVPVLPLCGFIVGAQPCAFAGDSGFLAVAH